MKKRILVVDDEESMLDAIKFILREKDYYVKCAKDGQEAFNKIKEAQISGNLFDLMITDIKMPNMNGMELIKKLKDENIKIPVITITGFHDREIMLDTIKEGCEAYLTKPLKMEKLLEHVNKLLLTANS